MRPDQPNRNLFELSLIFDNKNQNGSWQKYS